MEFKKLYFFQILVVSLLEMGVFSLSHPVQGQGFVDFCSRYTNKTKISEMCNKNVSQISSRIIYMYDVI